MSRNLSLAAFIRIPLSKHTPPTKMFVLLCAYCTCFCLKPTELLNLPVLVLKARDLLSFALVYYIYRCVWVRSGMACPRLGLVLENKPVHVRVQDHNIKSLILGVHVTHPTFVESLIIECHPLCHCERLYILSLQSVSKNVAKICVYYNLPTPKDYTCAVGMKLRKTYIINIVDNFV